MSLNSHDFSFAKKKTEQIYKPLLLNQDQLSFNIFCFFDEIERHRSEYPSRKLY